MPCRSTALILLLGILAAPAGAVAGPDGFEDIAKLEGRVVGALDADIGQPGGPVAPIDRRLKLTACPSPVTIDPPALGALPLRCEALGWRIRVPLVRIPGATPAMQVAAASPPPATPVVIKRGDPVQLVSGAAGFSVSTAGVAQEDGHAGGVVRVKTDAKGPVILGQVVDAGLVRVAAAF
jgi:flagella basal body P-ring formation protein FlgA